MFLYTTLIFLRSYIIRDYVVTLEYILTNVDYIVCHPFIDDQIICDTYY
jgi:hypothetical protein